MANKRRSFTTEFKNEAAALVVHQGYSAREACRSLEIGETASRRWIIQNNLTWSAQNNKQSKGQSRD
jgi:transposase